MSGHSNQVPDGKIECAHDEILDIDLLVPNPKNPNKHPQKQIKLLAKIMAHQGWRSPIVVSNRSGFIVKGHGRLAAALLNGWSKCPVDRQDYASEADEYADSASKYIHPTQKPVLLAETAIESCVSLGMSVLDLFGGSGSTLIACEKTNRNCFMMELDPHYCDVIVARWEKYTGKKAVLVNE